MSSEDSDAEPQHKRKRKVRRLEESPGSSSSSGSPIIGSSSSRRRRPFQEKNPVKDSSDSESDSGSSINRRNKRKKVMRVASDSDSESSGSTIVFRNKRTSRIASDSNAESEVSDRGFEGSSSSQWETDFSDTDPDMKVKPEVAVSSAAQDNNIDSDSSDGQSEKCPICLLSFKLQEIGTPESCDHMFCLECIHEWSKNMNTCPVDRQEYNLILVRKNINGRVIRQVQIEKPMPQNDVDIVEDPTFCEICGSSDNEDQMLLCDGCDLGFHLYCLTPALNEIPGGAWYCNDCSPDDEYDSEIELYEIQLLLDEAAATLERPQGRRRNQAARLVPRTRQSERVRRRIASNRQQNHQRRSRLEGPSTSSLEDSQPVESVSSTTSRAKRSYKRKKPKKTTKKQTYKIVYEIDEVTGETIAVKKRQKKYKKSRKTRRRKERSVARPKTVKKRLAAQLGICAPRTVEQNLPDVKVQSSSNSLGGLRQQAGIPTLHLFGQSNELDYFSGEDEEYEVGSSGPQLLTARAPNHSDISVLRRVIRRKAAISVTSAVSSSTDLLDSILSSQEQFHSRNSAYSVDSSGNFVIQQKKSQNNYVDVKKQPVRMRQKPNNSYYRSNNRSNPNYNRSNPNNYHSQNRYQYHSTPSSTMESMGGSSYSGRSSYSGGDMNEVPQDYTQRTLCASSEANTQERKEKDDDNTGTNTPNSESEIDIYSDIETVSTSRIDDTDMRPPSPPVNSELYNPYDDDNDSEPDMVIDDEKVQELERSQGDQKEEAAVTSTVGFTGEFAPAPMGSAPEMPHSSMEIQSGAIQSSDFMGNRNMEYEEDWMDGCPNTSIYSKESINALRDAEDADSDDGCPNFSIYSKESKSLALHTDISLSADSNVRNQQDYQVGEISSSPNVEINDNFQSQQNEGDAITYHPFDRGEVSPSPNVAMQYNFPPVQNYHSFDRGNMDFSSNINVQDDFPPEQNYYSFERGDVSPAPIQDIYRPEQNYYSFEREDASPSPNADYSFEREEANPSPNADYSYEKEANPSPNADYSFEREEANPSLNVDYSLERGEANPTPNVDYSFERGEANPNPNVDYSLDRAEANPTPNVDYSFERGEANPTPNVDYSFERGEANPSPNVDYSFEREEVNPSPNVDYSFERGEVNSSPHVDYSFERGETNPSSNVEVSPSPNVDYSFERRKASPSPNTEYSFEKGEANPSPNVDSSFERGEVNPFSNVEECPSPDADYSFERREASPSSNVEASPSPNIEASSSPNIEASSSPNAGIQNDFPPEQNDENVTYDFERDGPFPQENPEENVTYDFERNTDLAAANDNTELEENVTYEFEKFDGQSGAYNPEIQGQAGEHSNPPNPLLASKEGIVKKLISGGILGGLYSDSEDESVVKKDGSSFAISDINHMTEDISEEERSYTPCMDERGHRQGLEGLDTEMISDEDRNDFDESHELKTVSDGDALEINAKESELDFTRPEDYEEGEIVDKNRAANKPDEMEKDKRKVVKSKISTEEGKDGKKLKKKEKEKSTGDNDKGGNKENEGHNKEASFKKLSKSNKERNYRDKDTTRQTSPKFKEDRMQNKKEKKREKRKELERYSVRAIIAEKPRPLIIKDQFGRDIRRTPSRSKSRSHTPPVRRSPSKPISSPSKIQRSMSRQRSPSLSRRRSLSRARKSPSRNRPRKRRVRSRITSGSHSRSRSPGKKRSRSKNKKRKRSASRLKRRKSRDRSKKKPRTRSRHRSVSPTRRAREWNNRRGWTPLSISPTMEIPHMTPSWTPPRVIDTSHLLNSESLAAAISSNRKKKEKKRKGEKRSKENPLMRQRKRRRERERTPPPSKEVFASGDNILVSVSFNNENETRDVTTRERRKKDMEDMNRKKKEKRRNKNRKDLSGIKPVAIIDLERSPFKEITPSPKDVIVLTDSDNNDHEEEEEVNRSVQANICDSSQQVASPERSINYSMGPKTPPEPQIKFSLSAKPPQVRAITNPLHDPDDIETNDDVQEEISSRMNESLHKGPNTPPEPPNSPPSSPDVYDPFEPTKSRSPTPDPLQSIQSNAGMAESILESRAAIELLEKSINPTNPELIKSLTPPIADVQPADSQSSIQATPDSNMGKSPERIGVTMNQSMQPSLSTSKPVAQTTPFSSVPTLITSTPVSSNLAPSRINILNSTIITPPHVASSVPQRIILPNQVKSSPVKISPTKATIKSTPIKPMPNKNSKSSTTARKSWTQNGSGVEELNLDFDSPYSPGSSDYEDLFEPPAENIIKSTTKSTNKSNTKSPQKHQSVFDALFGSPSFNKSKNRLEKSRFGKKSMSGKTKTVGVKLDEDNLKILDELPNSAVEMQVKDKFLKKLNRQERVVEEVKLVLKPHYNKKRINKEEYKDILRRSVPKICHNKSGEINPTKIKNLIEAYVKKVRHSKKVTSSSSINPQKV